MKDQIVILISDILKEMGIPDMVPEVEVPEDLAHGDYTTNIAMILAKSLKKAPMEIALQVKEGVESRKSKVESEVQIQNIGKHGHPVSPKLSLSPILQAIDRVEVVPPGFINIFLTEARLSSVISEVLKQGKGFGTSKIKKSEGIMVEFGDPNTHKAFHIGHLRNITIGESVARLLEAVGAEVIHSSYQGDVGMHIAKCVYALLRIDEISNQLDKIRKSDGKTKVDFLGGAYAAGSGKFEENDTVKKEIGDINKKIYAKDPEVYPLYQESRQWSLDYFEGIYQRVGTVYKRNYFESEVYETGKRNVLAGLKKGIFQESEGAIIFPGEKFGLHNRVFITGEGNPTYEGKDMGLGPLQYHDLTKWTKRPTLIIRVVGPEQAGYFQVVFEAQSQLFSELRDKFYHLIAGWVKLKHGKMSSRSGNVVLGEWLLDEAKKSIYTILDKSVSPLKVQPYKVLDKEKIAEAAAVAAVKYAMLKVGVVSEIAFDIETSVSFDGDSGPYLQYTYARARSVLRRAGSISASAHQRISASTSDNNAPTHRRTDASLNPEERALARLINYFPEIVAQAASQLAPNVLCTYLFRLAQAFNLFYAKHAILGEASARQRISASTQKNTDATTQRRNDTAKLRLSLTAATSQVLKNGLYLLGIETLEQM